MIRHEVLEEVLSQELQNLIWTQYKKSFVPLKDITAQDQECYTKAQFMEMLIDPDYWKFLLFEDDKLIGFGNLSSNLEKAARQAYANPIKIQGVLSKEYAQGNIFYFNGLYIVPEYRNRREVWFQLIAPMVRFVDQNMGVAVFDYSQNANGNLGNNILFVVKLVQQEKDRATSNSELVILDHQVYAAIKLS
jgi:hypothetical protein